jgi:hypothetical protein
MGLGYILAIRFFFIKLEEFVYLDELIKFS